MNIPVLDLTRVFLLLGLFVLSCHGRMNVLFLAADDLRPELGAYLGPDFPGSIQPKIHTPNLDALAARSLLLKRSYVQQALCAPSRASLLTGRRPDTTHVYNLGDYWRDVGGNFTTIPQYFKQHGYYTVGIGKIFHPGDASARNDDIISWTEPTFHGINNFEDTNKTWKAVPDRLLKENPLRDEQIATRAIETLQRLANETKSDNRNFFLAVGFYKPHLPFVFPESVLSFYPELEIDLPANPYAPRHLPDVAWYKNMELLNQYADMRQLNATGDINTTLPDQTVLDLRRAYYSAVTWTDIQVGRVLAALHELGLENNTVVSFFGDHGYHLGEHAEWCKASNFDLALHAPLMVRIPGLTDTGVVSQQIVEHVDLFPTLVEAAGLTPLPLCPENSNDVELCREGTSLLPLIQNPDQPVKTAAFSQYPRLLKVMGYTIRTEQYRYTEWARFSYAPDFKPDWSDLDGVELYDHFKDPDENINRAHYMTYHDVRARLRRMLHLGWRHADQTALNGAIIG